MDNPERNLAQNLSKEIMKRFPHLKCKITHAFLGDMMVFGQHTAPSRYPWRIKIEHKTKPDHKCTFQVRINNNEIILASHKKWYAIDSEKFYDIRVEEVPIRTKLGNPKLYKDGTPMTRTKRVVRHKLFDLFSPTETARFFSLIEEIFA